MATTKWTVWHVTVRHAASDRNHTIRAQGATADHARRSAIMRTADLWNVSPLEIEVTGLYKSNRVRGGH